MPRPPDSRAPAGQQLEDRLDAITDEMHRRTTAWIAQSRRPAPHDPAMLSAILGGIAGAVLQELWEIGGCDPDRLREGWGTWVEGFIASTEEDAAAAAEANP